VTQSENAGEQPRDTKPNLRPVGVTQGPQAFPQQQVEAKRLQISRAACLRDLTEEYHFYTPGVLYAKVPMAPDLTASYIGETNCEIIPFSLAVDRPIVSGLNAPNGDPGWNHVLYAIELDHWDAYVEYVGTCAINHREQNTIWRVRTQDIQIFDPFGGVCAAVKTLDNSLTITAFVLESQHGTWMFNQDSFLPTLYFNREVHPDTANFLASIQKEKPNPYGDADEDRSNDALGGGV